MRFCIYFIILLISLISLIELSECIDGVWEEFGDLCYYTPINRYRTRCEGISNLKVEKRLYHDNIFWCVAIDNTKGQYHNLTISFSYFDPNLNNVDINATEPEFVFKLTKKNYPYDYKYSNDKYFTSTQMIPKGLHTSYFEFPEERWLLNKIISVKIDGIETCDSSRIFEQDDIFPNQENFNKTVKYLNLCREHNSVRSYPLPNNCESLDEINVKKFRLNNNGVEFWCVNFDKKLALDKYTENLTKLSIQLDNNNYHITWIDTHGNLFGNEYKENNTLEFFVKDIMILSVDPRNKSGTLPNIESIKIDDQELCNFIPKRKYDCGVRRVEHKRLIAFGDEIYPGKYPWHVALFRLEKEFTTKYICGGTIISNSTILTAAHCVYDFGQKIIPDRLRVNIGRHDLTLSTKYSTEHEVHQIIVHEKYDDYYLENDIAILKLKTEISYNDYVQPICLTPYTQPFKNKIGVVTGWGRNELNEKQHILSEISMPIVNNTECRITNRDFFNQFLNDGNFCAGYRNGTTVCAGDSGGGLTFQFSDQWYLRGIVSLGGTEKGECDLKDYVLFTDVIKYYDWIKSYLL